MKHSMKAITIAALVVLGAVALAQGGGGGRQGGRMMMGRGGGGPASIVNIAEVQTEIGLNDEQKTKLNDLREKQRAEQQARMEEMRNSGGGGFDPEAMRKQMAEYQAKNEAAVKEILTEAQWARVWEIWVQNQGNRAILNEKVQKDLGFTEEQTAKVKDLQAKQQEANQSMMERMRNGEIERDQIQDMMAKQNQVMDQELGKVLTPEQAEKLKAMGGKSFKLPERRGGGGL